MQAVQANPASTAIDGELLALENPFLDLIGASLVQWREGYSEFRLSLHSQLLNRQGVIQGGVLSTLLDVACGYAGLYSPPGQLSVHAHTVSLSVNFISKGESGLLVTHGYLVQRRRNLFFSRGEVWAEDGTLMATAQGSYKLSG